MRMAAVLFAGLLITGLSGCGKPPAAAIVSAPEETPQMKAAREWLQGGWDGRVHIDRAAVQRTEAVTDAHVSGIEAARMQFQFQSENRVAISASIPTAKGPAARNAMGVWTVMKVEGDRVGLQIEHEDQPTERVIITRIDQDHFTMPAPQNLGIVRFKRLQ